MNNRRAMSAATWLGVLWLGACSRTTTPMPDPNGQTHWLESCESSDECGGLSCTCGMCAVRCEDDRTCDDYFHGSTCSPSNAKPIVELCGQVAATAMCLIPCDADIECSIGELCREGACLPDRRSDDTLDAGDRNDSGEESACEFDAGSSKPEVVLFWQSPGGSLGNNVTYAAIDGDIASGFRLQLDCAPPRSDRFVLNGATGSTRIANASIYQIVPGALEASRDNVLGLGDVVLGQVLHGTVFWTEVDLEHFEGVNGFVTTDLGPLAAGYHLFIGQTEMPIDTLLEMGREISDTVWE